MAEEVKEAVAVQPVAKPIQPNNPPRGVGLIGVVLISAGMAWWFTKDDKKDEDKKPTETQSSMFVVTNVPPERGGITSGIIDAARDRAVEKAGTNWEEINQWVKTVRKIMKGFEANPSPGLQAAAQEVPAEVLAICKPFDDWQEAHEKKCQSCQRKDPNVGMCEESFSNLQNMFRALKKAGWRMSIVNGKWSRVPRESDNSDTNPVPAAKATSLDYESAMQHARANGRPILIMIGAPWCTYCTPTKEAFSRVSVGRLAGRVEFAYIDQDKDPVNAARHKIGTGIPQLMYYHNANDFTHTSWRRGLSTEDQILAMVK